VAVRECADVLPEEGQAVEKVAHLGFQQALIVERLATFATCPLMQIMAWEMTIGAGAEYT
jgi:hypothetical protein